MQAGQKKRKAFYVFGDYQLIAICVQISQLGNF